jgi:hypothetical protein
VLACADLREELGLDLLGLAHRGLGLAGNLLAHIALAANERVAAGVDLDLEAVAALADHGCFLCWSCPSGARMTAEQAKQVPQACDLRGCVGLAGLEPATERL